MNNININLPADIKGYQEEMSNKGFVKLKNIFSKNDLQMLKKSIKESEIYKGSTAVKEIENGADAPPMTKAVKGSNIHFRNDGVLMQETLEKLQQNKDFCEMMKTLTGKNLIRANDQIIEVAVNTHPGLNWHVGYYSFSYPQIEDYACTLWIPLDPITPEQRGGMQYISVDKLNGEFIYPFASWYFDKLKKTEIGQPYLDETVSNNHMVNAITDIIDHNVPETAIEEDNFDIGDAFLFNKFVIHKTSPFLDGPLKKRMAIVIRFIDSEALYDKKRFYTMFQHLENASKSTNSDAAYLKLDKQESNEKEAEQKIYPEDPFLAKLAESEAQHLTPIKEIFPRVLT